MFASLPVPVTVLLLAAVSPLLNVTGASAVKILAVVGQTVILPCAVPEENVLHVGWTKDGDMAFVYKDGCEAFGDKSDAFLYRTQLILQELKDGNMSLRLSDVRLSDAGTWTCSRTPTQVDCTVELSVGAASEPTLAVVPGTGVTLQCEAACWVPKPDVTFLDAQGNIIDAEASKYHQDTRSRCYNVTRRATVQAGNYFTCRVNQSEINQTKTVKIPDNCTIPWTVAIIAAVIMFSIGSAILFVYQRRNSEWVRKWICAQSSVQSLTSSKSQRDQAPLLQNNSELQKEIDELKSKLHEKDEKLRVLTEEVHELKSKLHDKDKNNSGLTKELHELKSKLHDKDENNSGLTKELHDKDENNSGLTKELHELKSKLHEKDENNSGLTKELHEVKSPTREAPQALRSGSGSVSKRRVSNNH